MLRTMQMIYFMYEAIKLDIANYGQLNIKFDCLSWTFIDVQRRFKRHIYHASYMPLPNKFTWIKFKLTKLLKCIPTESFFGVRLRNSTF